MPPHCCWLSGQNTGCHIASSLNFYLYTAFSEVVCNLALFMVTSCPGTGCALDSGILSVSGELECDGSAWIMCILARELPALGVAQNS